MNIKCTQNIYKSANGVSNVTYYILVPEGVEVRGIVQLSHGMCEYFSRYTAFAKYLCGLGFIVCGNDHIGHGASVSRTADLGFFAARDGWKYLVEDVKHLTDLMQRRYPDLPYFLLGHSMGSLIARLYLLDYGEKLSGCILIGTVGPIAASGSIVHLADSVARSRGITYRSGLLSNLVFKGFNRKIKQPKTVFDWLSRDTAEVDKYMADLRCGFLFTARGYYDMFTGLKSLSRLHRLAALPGNLPVLFISGDADPIGTQGKGVNTVAQQFRDAGVRDVTVRLYPGARHELFNETNRDEITAELIDWLNRHMK